MLEKETEKKKKLKRKNNTGDNHGYRKDCTRLD